MISDWNMEPMSGYDLLKEVRADPKLGKTPFIMITAESKTENVIAAKRAGVSNYIVKPFNAETLQSKIAAVFAEAPPPGGLTLPIYHTSRCVTALGTSPAAAKMSSSAAVLGLLPPAQLLGMDAGGDEQAIDAEGGGALEIGAHRIADRQHPRGGVSRPRSLRAQPDGLLVDRPVGLAGIEHAAA